MMWTVFAVCLLVGQATSNPLEGKSTKEPIDNLPGAEGIKINFKHHTGFLKASETHFLHYWFVEAQEDPACKPLIFWFNGGPGCSSMEGLLHELGPYNVNPDGKTLHDNPYSWNKLGSVVFIESPVGTGYSYSTDGNIENDDDQAVEENYEAIKDFFQQFPDFRNHQTYIMGESYGGVYAPMLTARIIKGNCDHAINLKGLVLANGMVNEELVTETSIRLAYSHGIISEAQWGYFRKSCCGGDIDSCKFWNFKYDGQCFKEMVGIFKFIFTGGLNPFDLYGDCIPSPRKAPKSALTPRMFNAHGESNAEYTSMRDFVRANGPLYGGVPCMNHTDITTYMNDETVREAIHIPKFLPKWELCNGEVRKAYKKKRGDMAPYVKDAVAAGVKVLLFHGDTDFASNFMLGQQFAAGLNMTLSEDKEPYVVNGQIAGFKTVYDGLQFVTVKGAGHLAPQMRPAETYHVVKQFISDRPI